MYTSLLYETQFFFPPLGSTFFAFPLLHRDPASMVEASARAAAVEEGFDGGQSRAHGDSPPSRDREQQGIRRKRRVGCEREGPSYLPPQKNDSRILRVRVC